MHSQPSASLGLTVLRVGRVRGGPAAVEEPPFIVELDTVNQELHKFEHVNKKAIDQFATFRDQLEDLEKEGTEITESRQSIEDFMAQVEAQKDQTLSRILEQVDKHFRDIFSTLVLEGKAHLKMVNAVDDAESPTRGVQIKVSFTGQPTSFLTMSQLSGGQKTVVAIALIFAIQRLEPAPFYLFDEIDAALDTQYRTAVAKLIAKESKNAQMVLTTFRKEIIDTADRFYRVYQRNRVSEIECVSADQARGVIEEQTRREGLDE